MRSVLWFYLFFGLFILNIGYLLKGKNSPKNDSINAFEIINTDTIKNIVEYPKDGLVSLEKFFPIIIPRSGYIEKGELFEAQVIMAVLLKNIPKMSSVSVNGQRVSLNENGIGYFSEVAPYLGKRTLRINENVRSTLSGERMSGTSTYEYHVGLKEDKIKELLQLQQEIKKGNIEIIENNK